MINWSLVVSIIVALSLYELCRSIAEFIYAWLTHGGNKNEDTIN